MIFRAVFTSHWLAGWPDLACRAYSIARNDLRQGFLPRGGLSPLESFFRVVCGVVLNLCRSIEHNNWVLSDLSGISDRSVSPMLFVKKHFFWDSLGLFQAALSEIATLQRTRKVFWIRFKVWYCGVSWSKPWRLSSVQIKVGMEKTSYHLPVVPHKAVAEVSE